MTNDYIPSTDAGLAEWLANFSALLTAAPATYGLTAPDAVIVAAQDTAYQAAYTASQDPSTRTPAAVAAKDAARASALVVVRPYAVSISQNPGVANEDKVAIGVTVRKLVPSPIPAPTAVPALSLVSAVPLVTTLQARNTATPTSKAKPPGSIGVEVWMAVGTTAAVDPAQLGYAFTASKIPFTVDFEASQQGKICSMACRYVTRGGIGGKAKTGPWSAVISFNVI